MMTSTWQRLTTLVRELGAKTASLYLLDRALRRVNHRCGFFFYQFWAQPVHDRPRLPLARGRAYSFRLIQAMDPALSDLGRPLTVISRRFSQGAQCLMTTKGDALVGCIWFVHHTYIEDEVRVDYVLPKDGACVWDFDVFVAPPERLGFLFAKQWDAFDALLKPQGVRYTISRINAFNQRSIASHRSLGAEKCGWALFLCLGSFQWMMSNQHPFVAFGGRPRLCIGPLMPSKPRVFSGLDPN